MGGYFSVDIVVLKTVGENQCIRQAWMLQSLDTSVRLSKKHGYKYRCFKCTYVKSDPFNEIYLYLSTKGMRFFAA